MRKTTQRLSLVVTLCVIGIFAPSKSPAEEEKVVNIGNGIFACSDSSDYPSVKKTYSNGTIDKYIISCGENKTFWSIKAGKSAYTKLSWCTDSYNIHYKNCIQLFADTAN